MVHIQVHSVLYWSQVKKDWKYNCTEYLYTAYHLSHAHTYTHKFKGLQDPIHLHSLHPPINDFHVTVTKNFDTQTSATWKLYSTYMKTVPIVSTAEYIMYNALGFCICMAFFLFFFHIFRYFKMFNLHV